MYEKQNLMIGTRYKSFKVCKNMSENNMSGCWSGILIPFSFLSFGNMNFFTYFQYLIFRVAKGPFFEDFYQCVTHGFYSAPWQEQLYTTFTLIFMFIIPLVILTGTYLSTFRTIASEYLIKYLICSCPCYLIHTFLI